ncbi:hypothetical protein BH11MYX1_BH11MYX1_52970 [soil metagenome]
MTGALRGSDEAREPDRDAVDLIFGIGDDRDAQLPHVS